jgi:acetyl-CoA carboxylase biotin carboxyl carrier protein
MAHSPDQHNEVMAVVRRLSELVEQHGLEELIVERDGIEVVVRSFLSSAAETVYLSPSSLGASVSPVRAAPTPAPEAPLAPASYHRLTSPMVGVFYRSSDPNTPPFVEIGDVVRVGQTVGLIEAMKVFSEIPADVSGRVVEVPAANGRLVQPGETLFVIDTAT